MNLDFTTTPMEMIAIHERLNRLLVGVLAMAAMFLLKRHYSLTTADGLVWILGPTARLTGFFTAANLVWEAGVGYADFGRGIIIAPACAGINFMIMAFGLAVLCGLGRLRHLSRLLAWTLAVMGAAYLMTLAVNTLRIVVSMGLYRADIYTAWLVPATLHRLAGVWLYLGALGLFFKGLQRIINVFDHHGDPPRRRGPGKWPAWLPLVWYLGGALGVPLLHLAVRRPQPAFGEHCLSVAVAAVVFWGGGIWIQRIAGRRAKGTRTYDDHTDCGR